MNHCGGFSPHREPDGFAGFGVNKVKSLTLDKLWSVFNKLHKLLEHPADHLCHHKCAVPCVLIQKKKKGGKYCFPVNGTPLSLSRALSRFSLRFCYADNVNAIFLFVYIVQLFGKLSASSVFCLSWTSDFQSSSPSISTTQSCKTEPLWNLMSFTADWKL